MSVFQVQRVGRIAKTISGSGFPPDYQGRGFGDLLFAKVSDISRASNSEGITEAANYVSYSDQRALGARIIPAGSVIFPKVGAALLGNSRAITLTKCLIDNNLMAVVPREGDVRYWKYVLLTIDLGELSGSGPLPYISDTQVRDLRIPFPSADEQRRIADFLDIEIGKIDALISLRSSQDRKLGEREASWRSQLFLASKSGVWTRVKHLLRSKPRYGVLVPEFVDDGVLFIRVANLSDLTNHNRLATISYEQSTQYARTVTMINDILVTVVGGTIGKTAIVLEDIAGANVARAIAVLRLNPRHASSLFTTWVETPEFMQQVHLATEADSAQPTLGMEDLANFSVRWPADHSEERVMTQTAREHQLDAAAIHATLNRQLALLAERRQALITAAVTGRVTV